MRMRYVKGNEEKAERFRQKTTTLKAGTLGGRGSGQGHSANGGVALDFSNLLIASAPAAD
jgi:hypothetical protein